MQFEVLARPHIGIATKGCCFLLSPFSGDEDRRCAAQPIGSPSRTPNRSRSMHDESLRCISRVLGCRHKPDVSFAFQDSSRLGILARPSITASTLPALRLVCLSPTPQGQNSFRIDSVSTKPWYICCASSADADAMTPSPIPRHSPSGLRIFKACGPARHECSDQPLEMTSPSCITSLCISGNWSFLA